MEAAGFVASVAQLAGTGLKLSIALYDYAERVSNAPKRLNDLAKDVKLTSSVLEHLSELLTQVRMMRPGHLQTAKDAITECSATFEEMQAIIEDGVSNFGRFMFPFKESKMQLLSARMASLKSTLQLVLQVLQYALTIAMQDPISSAFSLTGPLAMGTFRALIEERDEARKQYEQLKVEVGSSNGVTAESSKGAAELQRTMSKNAGESDVQSSTAPININDQHSPNSATGRTAKMGFPGEDELKAEEKIVHDEAAQDTSDHLEEGLPNKSRDWKCNFPIADFMLVIISILVPCLGCYCMLRRRRKAEVKSTGMGVGEIPLGSYGMEGHPNRRTELYQLEHYGADTIFELAGTVPNPVELDEPSK
ncbi:hypothetical protein NA57DRAFT_61381 [Rhizodiscina lignyota]|uniref:Fungal N-terminal domain-containing protein n=1 Tax=Rhizodiscina lignyota TaxID=1504668 RepID=A0A9P4I8G0_9PEZI|nr:hypothetical protein NA57DRAFT_61381 [Rhizodiscina lignyota]